MFNLRSLALLCNCSWFGLAFWAFTVNSDTYGNLILRKDKVPSDVYQRLSAALKFLGALNLPVAILSSIMLCWPDLFPTSDQLFVLYMFFGMSHSSQFAMNVPIALKELRGHPHEWSVLKGDMLPIFVLDGVFSILNVYVALFALP